MSRPLRAIAAMFCLIATAVAHAADALEHVPTWTATVTARKLNVRDGPGEGYAIVDNLRSGDTIEVFDQEGRWIRLWRDDEAWVYRAFISLPPEFMAPRFTEAQNAFLEWASETGELQEISVDGAGRLSIILLPPLYEDLGRAEQVARKIACAYRERLKVEEPATVTVWSEHGPAAGWVLQARCP